MTTSPRFEVKKEPGGENVQFYAREVSLPTVSGRSWKLRQPSGRRVSWLLVRRPGDSFTAA
jgi:hypothetical protein